VNSFVNKKDLEMVKPLDSKVELGFDVANSIYKPPKYNLQSLKPRGLKDIWFIDGGLTRDIVTPRPLGHKSNI